MAGSSRQYSAQEVLSLLQHQELFEDEFGDQAFSVDLDGESEDGEEPEGDFTSLDGAQQLIAVEYLAPESAVVFSQSQDLPPAERDSMLLLDPEINDSDAGQS